MEWQEILDVFEKKLHGQIDHGTDYDLGCVISILESMLQKLIQEQKKNQELRDEVFTIKQNLKIIHFNQQGKAHTGIVRGLD